MKKFLLILALSLPLMGHATCTGSGTSWSCTAGSTSAQIQTAINSATDGFTMTFAAGSYTLSSWVKFSNTVGGTLICASTPLTIGANPSGCIINFTSNNVFGGDLFGGTNTHFYRISGFVFDGGGSCSSTGTMWFDNANGSSPITMYGAGNGGIRIDHNTNQNCNSGAVFMFLGHNNGTQLPIGNYSGVADHNLIQGSTQYSGFIYIDQANPTPPSNQLGTIDNFFLEDNTLNFSAMPNASNGGCTDAWGGGSFVARYNTSNDCLWTAHGVTHAGGPANYEFYNNSVTLDSAATGESPIDCYRCFHPQGSGTMVGFGNTFTAPGGYNSEIISVANYRGYASGPSIDAAVAACDGTVTSLSFDGITFSDGNRTPATSNYGYPCWHQPGRDFAGNYAPMYWINNKTGGGALVPMVNPDFGGSVPSTFGPPPGPCDPTSTGNCDYNSFQMKANREWYNAVSASAQSSPTSPFNGTTGAGYGTLANRPTTCTTNATESGAGVGYFATDVGAQGTLYTCSATNTWATYYTPYTYPHPLVSGGTWSGLLRSTSGAGKCTPESVSAPQGCAIDWTQVGVVGGIPSGSWTQSGSTISAGASASTVQTALNACGTNHFVLLGAGAFTFNSDLSISSNCVLRGSGTQSTIITYTGTTGYPIMAGGTNNGNYAPNMSNAVNITSGSTAGSTSIVVASAANISVGGLIAITELNNPVNVSATTLNGFANFCDAYMFHNSGTRCRGQTVKVTSVSGTTIGFTPALYTDYGVAASTSPAMASPFGISTGSTPPAQFVGVENLQLFATNSAPNSSVNGSMISLYGCDECWVKGVEVNWSDSDMLDVVFCYRCEVRDNYFTNSFIHGSGGSDSELLVAGYSSGVLIQNNILERLHSSIIVSKGAAGNVFAYNYTCCTFDVSGFNTLQEDIAFHGANPQLNLFEGNITDDYNLDAFWGSSTNNTFYRSLSRGASTVAQFSGGGYTCSGPAHCVVNWSSTTLPVQQNRSSTITYENTTTNFLGNIWASSDAATAVGGCPGNCYNAGSSPYTSNINPSATRNYGGTFYASSFGYNTGSDTDGSAVAGATGGPSSTVGYWVGLAFNSALIEGNYDMASTSTIWPSGTKTLPSSFYLASKPAWFGSNVWPPIGPDVTGGSLDSTATAAHANPIPALTCYNATSRDSFGVKNFDPRSCYPSTPSYTWTVTATNGSVTGTNCPTATGIASGTTIGPCTAVPNAGYVFSSWSGVSGSAACSGATNPCPSFSITANSAVTANFVSGGVTVATGDTRTITEPTFPATCSTVQATKYIVSTNAVNIDPFNSTCGSTGGTFGTLGCTGGTSYEPSSTSGSYTAAETLDNSALTSALSACTSGKAVELVPGSSGQLGFVLSPLSLPSGVSLIVDAGIHVFASRNRTDYGGTNCGLVTSGTSGCNHWITAPSTTNSGIYGYGVLDGRGWDAYIGSTTQGFYANRIQAYCNNHGGAINGSPACTPNGSGNNSYGPNGLNIVSASNFTLYKTTVKDSGNFIFNWQGGNGLTAWGAKLIAPFEVSNTDGFDPLNSQNGTFTHGIISNGDNHVAVKSTSSASHNITISNSQTGAGIALALGTDINSSGINNVLFTNLVQRGNLYNSEAAGLQIGSSSANGGLADKIAFINDCMVNEGNSVRLYTNYGGQTGSSPPQYTNVLLRNIHVLASTAPYTTGNSGKFTFQGLPSLPMGVQVDNFVIDGTNQGVASQSGVTTNQYANIYLGPGAVASSLLTQFAAGTSVTTTGTPGSSTPYACTTSTWQPLVGDLNLKSATSNNNQSYTGPSTFTLQGVLQPATDISTKESPALTQPVTFLRDGVSIGTAPLLGDGSFASFTVSSSPVGTHLYTAQYPGDSYYPSFVFGSITVTNSTPVVTPPSFSVIFAQ